jgi:hypothetical protein
VGGKLWAVDPVCYRSFFAASTSGLGQKMSADSVIVFYGAQVSLNEGDAEACEGRTHPLMKAARDSRLDSYWADFIPDDEHSHELLVGRRFGVFGIEDSFEAHIEKGTITRTMDEVDSFLAQAGVASPGKLIVRFRQDL